MTGVRERVGQTAPGDPGSDDDDVWLVRSMIRSGLPARSRSSGVEPVSF